MTIKVKPLQGTSRTLDEWKELARRDDCLNQMVPSDLRCILSAIEAVDPATIRSEALRDAAGIADLLVEMAKTAIIQEGNDDGLKLTVDVAAAIREGILALIDKEQNQ